MPATVRTGTSNSNARGSIAIASNESIGTYFLPRVLPSIRPPWPNTRFAISVALCHSVRQAVEAGEADLGLFLGDPDPAAVPPEARPMRRPLGPRVRMTFFTQPRHGLALAGGGPIDRDRLVEFPLYISDGSGDLFDLVHRYFENDGLPGPSLEVAGTVEGVKRGVAGDPRAVGLLADYTLRVEIAEGAVATLPVRPEIPAKQVVGLVSPRTAGHPAVVTLLDELAALLTPLEFPSPVSR